MSALDRLRRKPPVPTTHLLPTGPVTLEESYELCRELNKRYGTTYYWSTKVLPKVKRHHVHALYAFCRYADDIVDEIPSQGGTTSDRGARRGPGRLRRPLLRRPRCRASPTIRC